MKKLMMISTISIFLALSIFNTAYSRALCKGKNGHWYDYGSIQCSPHRAAKNQDVTNNDEPATTTEEKPPQAISTIIPQNNVKSQLRIGPRGIIGSRQTQPDT